MHSTQPIRTRRNGGPLALLLAMIFLLSEAKAGLKIRGKDAPSVVTMLDDALGGESQGLVARDSALLLRKDSDQPAYQVLSAASASVQPPRIITQPQSVSVTQAGTITLTVDAYSGGNAQSFQWYKDGSAITARSWNPDLSVKVSANEGTGSYRCRVYNSRYAIYSDTATVSWSGSTVSPPQIHAQPEGASLPIGSIYPLSIGASGEKLAFQWRKDGVAVSGANDSIYPLLVVGGTHKYDCVVTAGGGASKTISSAVTVSALASQFAGIQAASAALNGGRGALVQISVTSSGSVTGKIVSSSATSTITGSTSVANGNVQVSGKTSTGQTVSGSLGPDGMSLTGKISKGTAVVTLSADRNPWQDPDASITTWLGVHNVALDPVGVSTSLPQGSGWATMTVSKGGTVVLAGALADGTTLSASTWMNAQGGVPVFSSLYTGKGAVSGALKIQQGTAAPKGNVVSGSLSWGKASGVAAQAGRVFSYAAGFSPVSLVAKGGYYSTPASGKMFLGASASVAGSPNARLTITEKSLPVNVVADAVLSSVGAAATTNSVRIASNPAGVTFNTINPKTGTLTGKFSLPSAVAGKSRSSAFAGIVVPVNGVPVAKGYSLIPKADAANGATNASERVSGAMEMRALIR
jgi:hypothetical protein